VKAKKSVFPVFDFDLDVDSFEDEMETM